MAQPDRERTYKPELTARFPHLGWSSTVTGLWGTRGFGDATIDDTDEAQEPDLTLWSLAARDGGPLWEPSLTRSSVP